MPLRPAAANPRRRQDFNVIGFEPTASITDATDLAHAGKFSGLRLIAAGGEWEESLWIKPSGF
jgi:hypothetical protein